MFAVLSNIEWDELIFKYSPSSSPTFVGNTVIISIDEQEVNSGFDTNNQNDKKKKCEDDNLKHEVENFIHECEYPAEEEGKCYSVR
ncbi:CLUMA_CG021614, isoform A [Clunio marinus]|uniref:CLUMA_CG021614, isoform A n=1 Tax=Clunio marinus TaxID=568069 RepID=A0A1J1J7Y9_9DIPT|nr:CLUMA_CG021614, isoform A [Clunio marinus]